MQSSPIQPGDVLNGKYTIQDIIGEGGMGVVARAHHIELDTPVAIKVLRPHASEICTQRFMREARAASQIESEHVARVFDIGRLEDETPYMVMELLEGRDLDDIAYGDELLEIPTAVTYVLQACKALAAAHRKGIVHRDVKPANLFLTHRDDGSPCIKLLDFGISKVNAEEELAPGGLTRTNSFLGSPQFMSPEQLASCRTVDGRSDLWSLAVTLFELLTTEPAFDGNTVAELYSAILRDEPRQLRLLRPEVPEGLEAVIVRCLDKDASQRVQTAEELARMLRPFALESEQELDPTPSAPMVSSQADTIEADTPLDSEPPSSSRPSSRRAVWEATEIMDLGECDEDVQILDDHELGLLAGTAAVEARMDRWADLDGRESSFDDLAQDDGFGPLEQQPSSSRPVLPAMDRGRAIHTATAVVDEPSRDLDDRALDDGSDDELLEAIEPSDRTPSGTVRPVALTRRAPAGRRRWSLVTGALVAGGILGATASFALSSESYRPPPINLPARVQEIPAQAPPPPAPPQASSSTAASPFAYSIQVSEPARKRLEQQLSLAAADLNEGRHAQARARVDNVLRELGKLGVGPHNSNSLIGAKSQLLIGQLEATKVRAELTRSPRNMAEARAWSKRVDLRLGHTRVAFDRVIRWGVRSFFRCGLAEMAELDRATGEVFAKAAEESTGREREWFLTQAQLHLRHARIGIGHALLVQSETMLCVDEARHARDRIDASLKALQP